MTNTDYAKMFVGIKYTWGGDTAEQGFDCSGFICEVLRINKYVGNKEDLTAQGLFNKFKHSLAKSEVTRGSLLFFGKSREKITHIAMALDNRFLIEAGGEGSKPNDEGFVRIRAIDYRSDVVAALKLPFVY